MLWGGGPHGSLTGPAHSPVLGLPGGGVTPVRPEASGAGDTPVRPVARAGCTPRWCAGAPLLVTPAITQEDFLVSELGCLSNL